MVRAIDRKLLRDLWSLKTQVGSIALVIGCGIGAFIGSLSTHYSLISSRESYYDSARFAHVFASAKRAPASLVEKIRAIPGVVEVETRVVRDAQLSIEGVSPPMIARLTGADFAHLPAMNRLTLKRGRWPAAGNEVVVNQRFLEARGLGLGERVQILLNGKLERLTLVGAALTPEYIYATRGGGMPDDEWFAVMWMDAATLAAGFDMEGAFNSVSLRTDRRASLPAILDAVDKLLEPYGGLGAVAREDQISHKILSQEINQQKIWGTVLPAIFLAVAAFILNVVLHRQVNAQRGEIAALKALGYEDRWIAWHYLKLAAVIVLAGVALGLALGAWLGNEMTGLYTDFFQFPRFSYRLPAWIALGGAAVALGAGAAGALAAIRGVLRLKAAEALRPPVPAQFRAGFSSLAKLLTPSQRMIARNLERRPVRAAITVAGIAGSVAILLAGTFWQDALDYFLDVQFNRVMRADVNVGFAEPVARGVRRELERLPGVRQAEVSRTVPVRLRAGHRSYRTAITGLDDGAALQRIFDAELREAHPPPGGLLLTARLAQRLGVAPGDTLQVELLEGQRVRAEVRVGATVREMAGMNAYLRLEELNRLARESDVVSSAALLVERAEEARLLERLKAMPGAAVVIVNRSLLETFRATTGRNMIFFTTILTLFAATIAVGVVYNNARIQLAERSWELASLRVLGFTRGEVSVLLLGELALEIALAIPLGFLAGYGLCWLLIALMMHQEVMEFPLVIFPATYLYAGAAVSLAGVAAALIVRNRIDNLDLVAVLKTRE